jgi:hypothetical protein
MVSNMLGGWMAEKIGVASVNSTADSVVSYEVKEEEGG